MTFTHLHVASGYSMQYGTSRPVALVKRAVELGLTSLALTDRDGLYGAVKFVSAASLAGISPVLGVDLAVRATGLIAGIPSWADPAASAAASTAQGTPVRGGGVVDLRHARVTVLAHSGSRASAVASMAGVGPVGVTAAPGIGWSALCRLVSATHLDGERGAPLASTESIARYAHAAHLPMNARPTDPGALTVLLGPGSELGRAILARRPDLARAVLAHWYDALPLGAVAIEIVCHDGPHQSPGSLAQAARLLGFAREVGIAAVLTAAVRYATSDGAVTADILDAARRLVPLDARHLDRTTSAGYLADAAEMTRLAQRIADAAGLGGEGARQLLADTERVADRCRLDAAADLGIGQVHLPEPEVVTDGHARTQAEADVELRRRCEGGIGWRYPGASAARLRTVTARLEAELGTIAALGYPTYFLTVGEVCRLIRDKGVRVAARGSGAGSLVNHLLGISGVEPIDLGLMMERFCTPLRAELPDIDLDVESARRTEIYEWILARFGGERVSCVSMMDSYRVRHAIRDVGAALALPPAEIDTIATAFPHIRARDVRAALADLPELGRSGLTSAQYNLLFDLVERLDGLPRHIAVHPCGVLLGNATLLDRTPVEASWQGFPMSQFDKDDVEVLGLLKLDVLGIRMQSAMAYAIDEITRVDGAAAAEAGRHSATAEYLDAGTGHIDLDAVPFDDEDTFRLIRSARTLGCFQIESPGQRELVGEFALQEFADIVIDISLFRPGPVKSDMINPFLRARQGWSAVDYLHPSLESALQETCGVVVFHEQVIKIVSVVGGVPLDKADEIRRQMGTTDGQAQVEEWLRPRAGSRGYTETEIEKIWEVLKAFASFGFCKAHAAAFALPTYQSAWLKAHHPAAFLAGVLTHDPGMYPKRLILDDARNLGITILGLDVNVSHGGYRVEKVAVDEPWAAAEQADRAASCGDPTPSVTPAPGRLGGADQSENGTDQSENGGSVATDGQRDEWGMRYDAWVPDGSAYGIRLALTDVKGITEAEVQRIVAGQPYESLADFWYRAAPSRPLAERLVLAGGFDSLYGLGAVLPVRSRGRTSHRDLLLQLADLDRWSRSLGRAGRRTRSEGRARNRPSAVVVDQGSSLAGDQIVHLDPAAAAARQSQAAAVVKEAHEIAVQTAIDLGDAPERAVASGLPELTVAERVRAELEILGLDASAHLIRFYLPMLRDLGVVPARALLAQRSRRELLVAGVKVATQTPPIRSGRRVVFLTLDDSTGPTDATFFEDVQGPYAATVFGSWLLLVRGVLRRTGPRGVSLRATGAWELPTLWDAWCEGGSQAVLAMLGPVEEACGTFERNEGPARVYGIELDEGHTRGPVDAQGPEAERRDAAALRQRVAARSKQQMLATPSSTGSSSTGPFITRSAGFPVTPIEPAWRDPTMTRSKVSGERPDSRKDPTGRGKPHENLGVRVMREAEPAPAGATPSGAVVAVELSFPCDPSPGEGAHPPEKTARRRVLVLASGYQQSPHAGLRPADGDVRSARVPEASPAVRPAGSSAPRPPSWLPAVQSDPVSLAEQNERARRRIPPRNLWHASAGSSGR